MKERWGGLEHLPKIALLRGEGFGLKSFGGEVVEGKCRCLTIDSLPRRYSGQYVRASAYAELDG